MKKLIKTKSVRDQFTIEQWLYEMPMMFALLSRFSQNHAKYEDINQHTFKKFHFLN